jgi:hypothetical protein
MATLREQALAAWTQEQQRLAQTENKKRKRRAKKIEADIDDLLPRDSEELPYERNLEDPIFGAVITVNDVGGRLRFTYDEKDTLAILGECAVCHWETVSQPVKHLEDLGRMVEHFEPGQSHDCTK